LDSFSENLRRHQFPRGSNSIPSFSRPEVSFICYVVILQQRIIGMMFLTTHYTAQPRPYAHFLISFFRYNGFGFLRLGRPTRNELCRLSFLPWLSDNGSPRHRGRFTRSTCSVTSFWTVVRLDRRGYPVGLSLFLLDMGSQ
jgi:hypothetical protein